MTDNKRFVNFSLDHNCNGKRTRFPYFLVYLVLKDIYFEIPYIIIIMKISTETERKVKEI